MSTQSMNGREPAEPDPPPAYTRWQRWRDGWRGRRAGHQGLPAVYHHWETTPPHPTQLLTPYMESLFTDFDGVKSKLEAGAATSGKDTWVQLQNAEEAIRRCESRLRQLKDELKDYPSDPDQDVASWRTRQDIVNGLTDDEIRLEIPIRHREGRAVLEKCIEEVQTELGSASETASACRAELVTINAHWEAGISAHAAYTDERILVYWDGVTKTHPGRVLLVRYTSLVPRARSRPRQLESGGADEPKALPGS